MMIKIIHFTLYRTLYLRTTVMCHNFIKNRLNHLEFLETELSDKLIASYRDDLDFQVWKYNIWPIRKPDTCTGCLSGLARYQISGFLNIFFMCGSNAIFDIKKKIPSTFWKSYYPPPLPPSPPPF